MLRFATKLAPEKEKLARAKRAGFDADIELPGLYVLWAAFALIAFSMPAA